MHQDRTALLLIEYQNDFTSAGGVFHDAVRGVMDRNHMLENSRRVAEAARERGVTVLHAPISFAAGYPEMPSEPYGILAGIVQGRAFRKGEWGAAICDAMAPQDTDIVLEGKRGLDCFGSTNIDFILRQKGITRLAIAGFLANCCVESTMRSAYERGFAVTTLVDCVASLSQPEQDAAITHTYPMFSQPLAHDAFLETLEAGR